MLNGQTGLTRGGHKLNGSACDRQREFGLANFNDSDRVSAMANTECPRGPQYGIEPRLRTAR